MKSKLITLIFFLFTCVVNGQDTLYFRGGEIIFVNIIKSLPETIEYSYPNESLINASYKNTIEKIVFKSGRIENITSDKQLPIVINEKDWEKVIIAYLENEVKGLTKVKELKGSSMWGGALGANLGYNKAIDKLKKQAAKLQCPIILITDKGNHSAIANGGGVTIRGVDFK